MERLRYTPIGWSKKYEFSEADFRCIINIIDEWIDNQEAGENIETSRIPFYALRSIIANNIYGGKIDNVYDLKILKSIVDQYFNENSFDPNKMIVEGEKQKLNNPDAVRFEDFRHWINNLEVEENPTWAGLPQSADDQLNIQKVD